MPLDLHVRMLTCSGCGREQPTTRYISNQERFQLDMQRQLAGNQSLKRILAEGVVCSRCGGKNPVPDDGSVQIVCSFCKNPILLSDHVDASAVARARLKHGIYGFHEEALKRQAAQDRRITKLVGGGIALAFALVVIAGVIASLLHR